MNMIVQTRIVPGSEQGIAVSILPDRQERGNHEQIAALIALFTQISDEEGWQPGDALSVYTGRSVYFAAYAPVSHEQDGTGTDVLSSDPVGGLQLVHPASCDAPMLPCQEVWPEVEPMLLGRSDIVHILVLVVRREWRSKHGVQGAFWRLGIALWRYCVEQGIREIWLEATPGTLQVYQRLGWPLTIRGEVRPHWGEACYLCSMTVAEVGGSLLARAIRSQSHRTIVQGVLEGKFC